MSASSRSFRVNSTGFTLVELMVVITIIAILSVVGVVVYSNVQKSARDARRKSDLEAIAQAYETKYPSNVKYIALSGNDFASGIIPKDPTSTKGDYFNWLSSSGSGFKICASLESNPNPACNTPARDCICKFSAQGSILPSDTADALSSASAVSLGIGGSTPAPACPSTGLVGYWDFEEDSGNTVSDKAGSANGAWVGTPGWQQGKVGSKAGNFNGSSYVNIPSNSAIDFATNNFTVSAWVKSTQGDRVVLGKFSSGSLGYRGWGLYVYSTAGIDFFGYGSLSNDVRKDATPLFDGNWHLVTGVYDFSGDSLTITSYKDGATVGTTTVITGSLANPSAAFQIGTYMSYNPSFTGQIDDVRIYNQVLSGSEIQSLASGCIP